MSGADCPEKGEGQVTTTLNLTEKRHNEKGADEVDNHYRLTHEYYTTYRTVSIHTYRLTRSNLRGSCDRKVGIYTDAATSHVILYRTSTVGTNKSGGKPPS